MVRKLASCFVCIAAVGVASAASTNEFAAIDIMETVRQSAVADKFTFSTTRSSL